MTQSGATVGFFRSSPGNPSSLSSGPQFNQEEPLSNNSGGGGGSMLLWDASQVLGDDVGQHHKSIPRLLNIIKELQNTLESTRVAYNQALQERDQKRQQLVTAEGRLADVQRVVQRYTVVQEPVVASDGYTYEKNVIKQYLDECEASETHAYSQQTKEILQDVLIPNQSLKKLVELLKTVKPSDVPVASQRTPIPPLRSGGGGDRQLPPPASTSATLNFLEEDDDDSTPAVSHGGKKEERVIHASDLEAAFSKGDRRGGGDGDGKFQQGRKDDGPRGGGASGSANRKADRDAPRLHPCLRVYGFCNFKDDCTFAKYPYDACLNNIKGKCRFGAQCKELHVNANDTKFQNPRSTGQQQQQQQQQSATAPPAPRSQREKKDRDD